MNLFVKTLALEGSIPNDDNSETASSSDILLFVYSSSISSISGVGYVMSENSFSRAILEEIGEVDKASGDS